MFKDGFGVKSVSGNTTILNNGIQIQGKFHIDYDKGNVPTIVAEEKINIFGTPAKDKVNIEAPYGGYINLYGGGDRSKITGENINVKEINDANHTNSINKIDMQAENSIFNGGSTTELKLIGDNNKVKSHKVRSEGNNNIITGYNVISEGDECTITLAGRSIYKFSHTEADVTGNDNIVINNDGIIGDNISLKGSGNKAVSKASVPCKYVEGDVDE